MGGKRNRVEGGGASPPKLPRVVFQWEARGEEEGEATQVRQP